MPTPTVHLIDASPYLFRAFFSVPKSIVDGKGKISNAVYGFTMFLAKYIADETPTHIAVAFDRHFNGSFRNDLYPPYKAQREASPPELEAQVDPALAVTEAIGVAAYIDETHEADDLIATIIEQTDAKKVQYVVVSSDKDLAQLVNARTTLVDPARDLRFDADAVVAKFGVLPEQMTDYLGLAGDAVDNIPGVRGVGPKTAAQLLQQYGSLEGVYENLGRMKNQKLAAKLEEHAEMAKLSKELATVSRQSPIRVTLDDLQYRPPSAPAKEIMNAWLGRK
ncbi:MAG TPA: 5'-3' exonuclease H3TH domain-containing protein [Thermoanaerobaculia bacterium]|nr:5'-3' exonuclease H3TH domain-containing protein [Thermoanaerobaculia bacterium]